MYRARMCGRGGTSTVELNLKIKLQNGAHHLRGLCVCEEDDCQRADRGEMVVTGRSTDQVARARVLGPDRCGH
eukprot:SAG31_NODE_3014_length_4786_cov_9.641135_1_plen_72_part_10